MRNCYGCGHQIHEDANFCPHCGVPSKPPKSKIEALPSLKNSNNPFYWMGVVFRRFTTFKGRSRRKEYWLGAFFIEILLIIFLFLVPDVVTSKEPSEQAVGFIILLAILILYIPIKAVSARRLHDIGRSGWTLLLPWLAIIPATIIAIFISNALSLDIIINLFFILKGTVDLWIIILMARKGYPKDNHFGPQPIV